MNLYRITNDEQTETFVVAETMSIALALWAAERGVAQGDEPNSIQYVAMETDMHEALNVLIVQPQVVEES